MTNTSFHIDHDSDSYRGMAHFESNCFRKYLQRRCQTAKSLDVSIGSVFYETCREIPSISSNRSILGGTPCIAGTRVPVYMIVEAVCHYGNLQGALEWYPQLSEDNVKDAMRFSKLVLECPIDNQIEIAS
jgi:uncharacterized protein (DUF433 family)